MYVRKRKSNPLLLKNKKPITADIYFSRDNQSRLAAASAARRGIKYKLKYGPNFTKSGKIFYKSQRDALNRQEAIKANRKHVKERRELARKVYADLAAEREREMAWRRRSHRAAILRRRALNSYRRKVTGRQKRYIKKKIKKYKKSVKQGSTLASSTFYWRRKNWKKTKRARKMFKAGNVVKLNEIKNTGDNVVDQIGFNKYRYLSMIHLPTYTIAEYLDSMPFKAFLNSIPTNNSNNYFYTANVNYDPADYNNTLNDIGLKNSVVRNEGQSIYIGRCTYTYEINNPTNYNVYVDIYDLVARQDYLNFYPSTLQINDKAGVAPVTDENNQVEEVDTSIQYPGVPAPEGCIYYGSTYWDSNFSSRNINDSSQTQDNLGNVYISDNFIEKNVNIQGDDTLADTGRWNSIGVEPTTSRWFNKMWKIKKKTTVALEPNATYVHQQRMKIGEVISRGDFYYRFPAFYRYLNVAKEAMGIIGGLTSCCLIRAYGQLSTENNTTAQSKQQIQMGQVRMDGNVFNLPAKLLVKQSASENIYFGSCQMKTFKRVTNGLNDKVNVNNITILTNLNEKKLEDNQNDTRDGMPVDE